MNIIDFENKLEKNNVEVELEIARIWLEHTIQEIALRTGYIGESIDELNKIRDGESEKALKDVVGYMSSELVTIDQLNSRRKRLEKEIDALNGKLVDM